VAGHEDDITDAAASSIFITSGNAAADNFYPSTTNGSNTAEFYP
jgi:hypothetical protein